ncbi:uncharacterized protein [Diadema setosum]|uniref:uncharacterized protein n=1 Tax=Diadema setosum TaxID=31175 RepID=UPI003B3B58EC
MTPSLTSITGVLIAVFSALKVVYGDICPIGYGFNCPRPGIDPYDFYTCCRINGLPTCCDTSVLAAWAVGVIVVTILFVCTVFGIIFCACCPCCWLASRRRRSQYVVVSQEAPAPYQPPAGTTSTTYVYSYPTAPNPPPPTYPAGSNQPPPNYQATQTTTYVKQ